MYRVNAVCLALVLALGLGLLPRAVAHGQSGSTVRSGGRVIGVYDERTGNPIDSAKIVDVRSGTSALTTSTGTVALSFVDTTGGTIEIRKIGYEPLTLFVDNRPGLPPLTVALEPVAQRLPVVNTVDSSPHYRSPALRQFEDRRQAGHGHFIPEAVIRKAEGRTLGNLIKGQVVGLDVREMRDEDNPRKFVTVAVTTRGGKPCPVDVFLDGVLISAPSTGGAGSSLPIFSTTPAGRGSTPPIIPQRTGVSGLNDLSQFDLRNLAAVESYSASTVPAEFNRTSSGCGTLLLWSRER